MVIIMGIIMEIMDVLPATTGYLWGISLGYSARDFQAKRDPAEIFYRPKTIVWCGLAIKMEVS
jgi:hypothetical protein